MKQLSIGVVMGHHLIYRRGKCVHSSERYNKVICEMLVALGRSITITIIHPQRLQAIALIRWVAKYLLRSTRYFHLINQLNTSLPPTNPKTTAWRHKYYSAPGHRTSL